MVEETEEIVAGLTRNEIIEGLCCQLAAVL